MGVKTIFNIDFWFDQITGAAGAWAVVVPILLLTFWAGFKLKTTSAKIRELEKHRKHVESRLELARELNAGESKAVAQICSELAELRKLIESKARPNALEPIVKEVEATAEALSTAKITTNHVLTAG